MDKQQAGALRALLASRLTDLEGVAVEVLRGTYDSTSVTFKVRLTPGGAEALADKAKADFEAYAGAYGLKGEYFGKEFTSGNGQRYKVVELKPGSSRYPVIGERPDGKRFKLPTLAKHPERLPLRVDLRIRTRDGDVMFRRTNVPMPATLKDVRIVSRRDPARGTQRWLVWTYDLYAPSQGLAPSGEGRMRVSDCRSYFVASLDDWRLKPAFENRST
jgi:hypothetical protein